MMLQHLSSSKMVLYHSKSVRKEKKITFYLVLKNDDRKQIYCV